MPGHESISRVNQAVRMHLSQSQDLETVLTRAFHNDPGVAYILPDEGDRRAVLSSFFRFVAIRASQFCGEIYTTAHVDGGALWICPGRMFAFEQIVRAEMRGMPFKPAHSSVRRWASLRAHLDRLHQRLAKGPHWYLMALGVEPSKTWRDVGAALVKPILSRADSDRLSCYVETFDETLLPFLLEWAFRIEGAGQISRGGPDFWGLLRAPVEA